MPEPRSTRSRKGKDTRRLDPIGVDPWTLWSALSRSPGIGVSITDIDGKLLFVNDTCMALFSETTGIDYEGKTIADFHPPEFVAERLAMLREVVDKSQPVRISHVYRGRRIESTLWPIRDKRPPFNRIVVVSHQGKFDLGIEVQDDKIETVETQYIDLGPLNVLSRRELEVLVMLGHGMNVPKTAKILHRSPKTIQRHKSAISNKLGLRGQAELVQHVTSLGLELSDASLQRFKQVPKPKAP